MKTPTIKLSYFLKPNGKDSPHAILLRAFYGYKQGDTYKPLRYNTGLKVYPSFWNNKEEQILDTGNTGSETAHFNHTLFSLKKKCKQLIEGYALMNKGEIPTPEYLKAHLDNLNEDKTDIRDTIADRPVKNKKGTEFRTFIKEELKREKDSTDKESSTINSYGTLLTFLKDYEQENQKPFICEEITEEQIINFISWLKKKDMSSSYLDKQKKGTKKYLKRVNLKFKLNLNYQEWECLQRKRKVKGKVVDSKDSVYLTIEELDKIEALQLDRKDTFQIWTKDLLLIACYCGGMRISDYPKFNLKKDDKKGRYFFEYLSDKTGTYSKIPAPKKVIDIYNKYEGKLPKMIEQVFNRNLKKLCMRAGIDQEEIITERRTTGNITRREKKYNLISSHSLRRTFCTNMVKHFKVNPAAIIQFSNHTSLEQFMEYVKLTNNDYYEMFAERLEELKMA